MQNRSVTLGQCGFFSAENGEGVEEMHYPDMEQAEMMPEAEKLLHEKRLVGFYLSRHPLSPYRRDWQAFATLLLDSKEVVAARQYKVIGVIVSVKHHQDKKGKQMLFGCLEDFTGKADFTVFASLYEQYGHHFKPEEVVMLVAEGEVSGGILKLLVREVVPIKKVRHALVKKVILKIDADDQMQLEKLEKVKKIFNAAKGGTPVEFEVKAQSGDNIETITLFARSTPVDPSESTLEKLEEILGADNVRISG